MYLGRKVYFIYKASIAVYRFWRESVRERENFKKKFIKFNDSLKTY